MECNDDQWIRLFNVSDPRRAYAGHTLYKVTSKLFQREYPEGSTEVAVWRRFSDFKKLHQELLKIYVHKHFKDEEFPRFPKAKFFGRFEDGVIEERRKAALDLLNFAGNIPDLFTSQPFVKFFEVQLKLIL
ncbi:PREDICTED: sorting nexin-15-like [Acropora digitifera]|uniref:sorting nexin-15-like n=1 Tax=Acropora digitifera TaxID=70779 RepID=UPI00077A180A|nr:PREDICTED: sorting nexin-15-like [Acropora digitifera]